MCASIFIGRVVGVESIFYLFDYSYFEPLQSREENTMKLFTGILNRNIPGALHQMMNGKTVHVTIQMVSEARMATPEFLSMYYAT
jgi:hypothetical protein